MMNEEFCQYLSDNEFSEFMQLWKKQYEKYGTCKGSIDLVLDDSNRECISGLMGKDYYVLIVCILLFANYKRQY